MRYNLFLNQVKMLEWGLNLAQAAVFSVLNEANSWTKSAVFDGDVYYWFSKSVLMQEVPIVTDKIDTISRHLAALDKAGLIKRKSITQGEKTFTYICITSKGKQWNVANVAQEPSISDDGKKIPEVEINEDNHGKKIPEPREKNPTNHSTSNHITNDPKDIMSDSEKSNVCPKSILEYLNLKTKKRFKPTTKNLSFINARLDEGYSPDDLKLVVDRKAAVWLNDRRWNEYLRPSTLFNSEKFESYLNASPKFPTDHSQTGDNHYDSTKNRKLSASERQFQAAQQLMQSQQARE